MDAGRVIRPTGVNAYIIKTNTGRFVRNRRHFRIVKQPRGAYIGINSRSNAMPTRTPPESNQKVLTMPVRAPIASLNEPSSMVSSYYETTSTESTNEDTGEISYETESLSSFEPCPFRSSTDESSSDTTSTEQN